MKLAYLIKASPVFVVIAAGLLAFGAIKHSVQISADKITQIIHVGTDAELQQALSQAEPGATILLKPGTYSPFSVLGKDRLTIQAEKLLDYEATRKPYEVGDLSLLPHVQGTDKTKDVIYARGTNLAFRGLHISVAQRNGILIDNSQSVTVESSVIHDVARTNGQGILFDSTRNATAKNNVIYDIRGSRAHAIYAAGSASDNPRFIGNRGYNIDGAVYQLNAEDRRGDKTISGAVITNNIAQDGPFGGNFCGVITSHFFNNVGFRLDKGFTFYSGDGLCTTPHDNKLYHNTLITRSGEPINLINGQNYDIRNNIFVGGAVKGVDSIDNLIEQPSATLADLFLLPDGQKYLDYRLKGTASAIDKGAVLPGVSTDFLGSRRNLGTRPDFGAFEYDAANGNDADDSAETDDDYAGIFPVRREVSKNGLTVVTVEGKATLSWKAYDKIDLKHYIVSRRDEGSSTYRAIAKVSPSQRKYIDSTVESRKTYRYKIRIETEKRSLTGKIRTQVRDWIEAIQVSVP